MPTVSVPAAIYCQHNADASRDIPAEGYGGWTSADIDLSIGKTALVVMHAWRWEKGAYPGWDRCVEYWPRADRIVRSVFPGLLSGARAAGLRILHVTGGGGYYTNLPGYRRTVECAGVAPEAAAGALPDEGIAALRALRRERGFPGAGNGADVQRGWAELDFPDEARPAADEYICDSAWQLNAVCRHLGIVHLIYAGFAINWCLLLSPGGMSDMGRLGYLCSTIREAVTAVENRESARTEAHKEEALWRVALGFGFVFDLAPFLNALHDAPHPETYNNIK